MQPYREIEDRLGAEEREEAAVELLGLWRMRVRSRALTAASFVGVVAGVIGIWTLIHVQFALSMRASIILAVVIGFGVPFAAALALGIAVARQRIAAGRDRKLRDLSNAYRVELDRLRRVADLIDGL